MASNFETQLTLAVKKKGKKALHKILLFGLEEAKRQAPVDKGNLQRSIRITEETEDFGEITFGGIQVDGVDVDYAVPVALGHSTRGGGFVPANPFHVRTLNAIQRRFPASTVSQNKLF